MYDEAALGEAATVLKALPLPAPQICHLAIARDGGDVNCSVSMLACMYCSCLTAIC
jgi:hypothetical protein